MITGYAQYAENPDIAAMFDWSLYVYLIIMIHYSGLWYLKRFSCQHYPVSWYVPAIYGFHHFFYGYYTCYYLCLFWSVSRKFPRIFCSTSMGTFYHFCTSDSYTKFEISGWTFPWVLMKIDTWWLDCIRWMTFTAVAANKYWAGDM